MKHDHIYMCENCTKDVYRQPKPAQGHDQCMACDTKPTTVYIVDYPMLAGVDHLITKKADPEKVKAIANTYNPEKVKVFIENTPLPNSTIPHLSTVFYDALTHALKQIYNLPYAVVKTLSDEVASLPFIAGVVREHVSYRTITQINDETIAQVAVLAIAYTQAYSTKLEVKVIGGSRNG